MSNNQFIYIVDVTGDKRYININQIVHYSVQEYPGTKPLYKIELTKGPTIHTRMDPTNCYVFSHPLCESIPQK